MRTRTFLFPLLSLVCGTLVLSASASTFGQTRGVPFGQNSSAASFAWRGHSGNHHWRLGVFADQGSSQTLVGQSSLMVLPHGGSGHFFSGVWTPFVTGWIPVVGVPTVNGPFVTGPIYGVPMYGGFGGPIYCNPLLDLASWDAAYVEPVSPVRERWARLQLERMQQTAAVQAPEQAVAEAAEADEDQPPPIPKPPRPRKPDDPPLILLGE